MKPTIWGPTAWIYLHLLSFNYPDNPSNAEKNNNKLFLEYFGKTLPCLKCRENFQNHIKNFDIDSVLDSKANYINFIWKMHNKVNKHLKKDDLLFNTFIQNYKKVLDVGNLNPQNQLKTIDLYRKIIIMLIVIIIGLFILLYYKLKK
jgi:hypothetical protein